MSNERIISIVTLPDKSTEENKIDSITDIENKTEKSANFERAITAAGYGKFQYFLLLSIIPVSWSTSLNTSSVGIILPSAECDLQITFYQKGVLTAIVYVGMVCSGPLWGYIADVKGRRTVFLFGYLADGICNILSGLSQNFWTLLFFKFLSGFIISGPHASIVAYSSEFYGKKGRGKIPLLIGFSITLGNIVSSALALIIIPQEWSIVLWDGAFVYNSWRFFLSACSMPILIGVVCLFMFPESPKFLMSQDRMDDALKVFQRIYSINTGKPPEQYPIQYLQNDPPSMEESSNVDHDENMKKKKIFTNPYLSRLFSVIVMQFGSMFATNTFRLWQPQLFTILENFDPLSYNLTAEHESTFCEILDFTTSLSASENIVENATCKNGDRSEYRNDGWKDRIDLWKYSFPNSSGARMLCTDDPVGVLHIIINVSDRGARRRGRISENIKLNRLFAFIEISSRFCHGHATSGDNDEAGPRGPTTSNRMTARQRDCHPEEATQSRVVAIRFGNNETS
ncbi:Synaptic vesicle glycoprotein 2C [Apis cerana cerana]|uniref:Synaptic vesicle glycoprotein 2C n=1 Tax=Apis cerana cerana TaxID=94128 RepID=A0A2A3EHC0_APICC|nr:Synaptic vesicle glycoprotein 2C [Apis cerana cerana]